MRCEEVRESAPVSENDTKEEKKGWRVGLAGTRTSFTNRRVQYGVAHRSRDNSTCGGAIRVALVFIIGCNGTPGLFHLFLARWYRSLSYFAWQDGNISGYHVHLSTTRTQAHKLLVRLQDRTHPRSQFRMIPDIVTRARVWVNQDETTRDREKRKEGSGL